MCCRSGYGNRARRGWAEAEAAFAALDATRRAEADERVAERGVAGAQPSAEVFTAERSRSGRERGDDLVDEVGGGLRVGGALGIDDAEMRRRVGRELEQAWWRRRRRAVLDAEDELAVAAAEIEVAIPPVRLSLALC